MLKRIFIAFWALILVFSITACNEADKTNASVDKAFFDQTAFNGGKFVIASSPTNAIVTSDYDEVYAAFEALADARKLDELTYAFNYDGSEYTVKYYFFASLKDGDTDVSTLDKPVDWIPVSDKIFYGVSIKINGAVCENPHCSFYHYHPEDEERTAQINLLFIDTDEAPIINRNTTLKYEQYTSTSGNYTTYRVIAEEKVLFDIYSCVPMTDEIFEFFNDYLVQFDGRAS